MRGNSENRTNVRLDDAVEAFRARPPRAERLSDAARASLFDRITRSDADASPALASLFAPWRRWALGAAAVPAVLVALVLAWAPDSRLDRAGAATAGSSSVQVSKVGDRVVFTIANGHREHQVVRSDRPDRFDLSGATRVSRGSFVDRLDSGPDLVFYRID